MDKVQIHKTLCEELNKTYEKKNHDYGNSFGETFEKLGIISAITRISDKYNRLVSLCTKSEEERKVKDESITDTLLDMANYCIMTVIELHKNEYDDKTDKKSCEHNWEFLANNINFPAYKFYRCAKCGTTKQIKVKDDKFNDDFCDLTFEDGQLEKEVSSTCDHRWQFEATRFDSSSTYERHRCSKCGIVKEFKVIGL